MKSIQIELLADHPEAVPFLKELFEIQWQPYYGQAGPGNAQYDLINTMNRTRLPIAIVALIEKEICGTAALKKESVTSYPDYYPWLAALLVAPAHRRQGVGNKLIANIEALASRMGFNEIYTGTGENSGLSQTILENRNWQFIDSSRYFISEASIYRKQL